MRHRESARQCGQHLGLTWHRDQLLDALGQRLVVLGVNTDSCEDALGRDGGCPETGGVSNAANQAGWPLRLAHRAKADWCRRVSELGESLASAAAGRHELATSGLDGMLNKILLAREYRFAGSVLERFNDRYTGGQ